jgi:hypothetical protein
MTRIGLLAKHIRARPASEKMSPQMGAAASDLLDPAIKRKTAESVARKAFRDISKLLGQEEAQRIFSELATPPSAKMREEFKKIELLTQYIMYRKKGMAGPKSGAHLAEINKRGFSSYGVRGGYRGITNEAIEAELRNLLGKRPPKHPSPLLGTLMKEARSLPKQPRGRPRKQSGPK